MRYDSQRTGPTSSAPRPGAGKPRWRVVLSAVGLALLVVASGLGLSRLRVGQASTGPSFDAVYPHYDTLVATVDATGQIKPARIANLSFRTPGLVSDVLVKVGDTVARGAPLARLDDRELRLRVVQAQAALDQAKANYQALAD